MKFRFAWWRIFYRYEIQDTSWRIWDEASWKSRHCNLGQPIPVPVYVWLEEIEPKNKPNFKLIPPRKIWGFSDVPYVKDNKVGRIRFRRKCDALIFKMAWS